MIYRCLELDGNFHLAHVQIAKAYEHLNLYSDAISHHKQTLTKPGGYSRKTVYDLGLCYRAIGAKQEEFQLYEQAVQDRILPNVWQRPFRITNGVPALPWYDTSWFNWIPALEKKLPLIRREYAAHVESTRHQAKNSVGGDGQGAYGVDRYLFQDSPGLWSSVDIYDQGQPLEVASHFQETLNILKETVPVSLNYGRVLFSSAEPGLHIEPHCGPLSLSLSLSLYVCI